ncbi:3'-5' exonuclease [Acidithiobacillus ferrooxidans]|uniref:3'-5' exonuclease n=1 Tax=Acidithiobacillus ferrooxidans TaxID=920 RepID=UPI000A71ADB5|nr:3'-5' exonuclease [Acidithiobacillus ferrooxidans]
MNHIMIDIETLSRKLGAVVLSIGAVAFDPDSNRLGETFSIRLPAQEQIDKGGLVEMETVLWWMGQSLEARNAAFQGPCAPTVAHGLGKFSRFLQRVLAGNLRVWSNGPSFDSAQLQLLFDRFGVPWPVKYNADRDCRTIFELAYPGERVPVPDDGTVQHDALADAVWQARAVQACVRKLRCNTLGGCENPSSVLRTATGATHD